MATKFLKSKNIKVFPTAYRNHYDPGSKFFSEENIGNIINSIFNNEGLTNIDGFVVGDPVQIVDGSYITFNIHGYWFRFQFNYSDFSDFISERKIYAVIQITTDNTSDQDNVKLKHAVLKNLNDPSATNLDSDDTAPSTSLFGGIKFFDSPQTLAADQYQLCIGQYYTILSWSYWKVPETSVLRLNSKNILNRAETGGSESDPKSIRQEFSTNVLNVGSGNPGFVVNSSGILTKTLRVGNDVGMTIDGFVFGYDSAYSRKYVWWIDKYGNFFQMNNNPQNTLVSLSGFNNAIITCVSTSPVVYEADWSTAEGKRKFVTGSSFSDLEVNRSNGQQYVKMNAVDNNDGTVAVTFMG